jgi:hypothetical protein
MSMISNSQNVAVASAVLQERMQQLQSTDWETLTDSESYQDQTWTDPEDGTTESATGLLKAATQSATSSRLEGLVESVRISAYRPAVSAVPDPGVITVTRNGTTGVVTQTGAAANLVDEKMVRIDVRLTWTDSRMRLPCSSGSTAIVARK